MVTANALDGDNAAEPETIDGSLQRFFTSAWA